MKEAESPHCILHADQDLPEQNERDESREYLLHGVGCGVYRSV